ncbi:MAG: OmpA family protein [Spirochaetales bacterium]
MVLVHNVFAQTGNENNFEIRYEGSGTYWMVERSDLRRYDNGKYTGLTQREVRSFVYPVNAPAVSQLRGSAPLIFAANNGIGTWFDGNFFVNEKTLSGMQQTALGLEGSIPAAFYVSPDGILTPHVDNGFPTFRSFPAFPQEEVKPGDSWTAEAVRSVDPLNKGIYTKLPMLVQYTFVGEEVYLGEAVYRIKAQWATRYGKTYWDYDGDPDLKFATGAHRADIIVLQDTGAAILIQDIVDESFEYHNGQTVQFKGSINLFTEFAPSVNTNDILPALERIATVVPNADTANNINDTGSVVPGSPIGAGAGTGDGGSDLGVLPGTTPADVSGTGTSGGYITQVPEPTNNMVVEKTPAGLRLSVRDIRFVPDSSEFLEDEYHRLDMIADTLKAIPNAKFLVEGHTASVGDPLGEKILSVERAERTIDELVKRGISADRFISNGFGGERPLQSNDTAEGMAINRRVEITILE